MDFASTVLKSAKDLKQIKTIVEKYRNEKPILVLSGISKINIILTEVCNLVLQNSDKAYLSKLELIKTKSLLFGLNLIPKNSAFQNTLIAEINDLIQDLKFFLKNIHITKELNQTQKNYIKAYSSKITAIICKNLLEHYKIQCTINLSEDLIVKELQNPSKSIQLSRKKSKQKLLKNISKKIVIITNGLCRDSNDQLLRCKSTASLTACLLNTQKLILWTPSTVINQADPKICPQSTSNKVVSYNELQEVLNLHINGHIYIKNITTAQNCKIPTFLQNINNPETGTTKILSDDNLSPHSIKGIYTKKNISLLTINSNPTSSLQFSKLRLDEIISNADVRYYYLNSTKNYTNIALNNKDTNIFLPILKPHKNYIVEKNYCLVSVIGIGLSGNLKAIHTVIENLRKAKIEIKSMQLTFPHISFNLVIKELDHDLAVKTIYQTLFN